MKKVCFFISLFFATQWGFCQSEKKAVDLDLLYREELKVNLFPQVDPLKIKEVLLFVAEPSFKPEYSLRIMTVDNQHIMEVRLLEKSLWGELLQRAIERGDKPLSLSVSFFSVPVSNKFKNNMLKSFTEVVDSTKNENDLSVGGIIYQFWIFDKKGKIRSVEVNAPEIDTIQNRLATLCTSIVNDVNSRSFDESEYNDKL